MASTQGVKLEDEVIERLKKLGEARQRSPHWLMKTAIETYLEREERYEREKAEDMERWEAYQLTGHFVPQAAVTDWLAELGQGKSPPCPK